MKRIDLCMVTYGRSTETKMFDINTKYTRSYKTRAALEAAIVKFGFNGPLDKYVVVRNDEGRWTAIFSSLRFRQEGGYVCMYAERGFLTI
jgi:hypothetical protein